jgi:hypothetical protein
MLPAPIERICIRTVAAAWHARCTGFRMHVRCGDLVVTLVVMSASLPRVAAAEGQPTDQGYIAIAGPVTETAADGFTMYFEGLHIRINMTDWRWKEDYRAFANRQVVVSGPLRSIDFEARSLRPDAVYVGGLDIYYERRSDSSITSDVLRDPPDSGFASVRATVQPREGKRLELSSPLVDVDTSGLRPGNTSRLEPGQSVLVSGLVDATFWKGHVLRADRVEPVDSLEPDAGS